MRTRTKPALPARLAVPRPSRLCQRCFPATPGVSRIGLRSAPTTLLRQPSEEVSQLPRFPALHGAPRRRHTIGEDQRRTPVQKPPGALRRDW